MSMFIKDIANAKLEDNAKKEKFVSELNTFSVKRGKDTFPIKGIEFDDVNKKLRLSLNADGTDVVEFIEDPEKDTDDVRTFSNVDGNSIINN